MLVFITEMLNGIIWWKYHKSCITQYLEKKYAFMSTTTSILWDYPISEA